MSRVEKFGRSRRTAQTTDGDNSTTNAVDKMNKNEAAKLPPRRKKFPSSGQKAAKWFYNLLFVIFVGLVVFLFWYGNKFS